MPSLLVADPGINFRDTRTSFAVSRDNQLQNALKLDLSEIETATRAWIDTTGSAEAASVFSPLYWFPYCGCPPSNVFTSGAV